MEQAKKLRNDRGKLHLRKFRRAVRRRNEKTRRSVGFTYSIFAETIARGEKTNDEQNRRIISFAKTAVDEGCNDIDQIATELMGIALWTKNVKLGKEAVEILERLNEKHSLRIIKHSAKNTEIKIEAGKAKERLNQ